MAQSTFEEVFESDVIGSAVPVLVEFRADWCGPCKSLDPIIERLSAQSDGSYKVVKVNVDDNPALADIYAISAIPTVALFSKGTIVKQFVGVQSEKVYIDALGGTE